MADDACLAIPGRPMEQHAPAIGNAHVTIKSFARIAEELNHVAVESSAQRRRQQQVVGGAIFAARRMFVIVSGAANDLPNRLAALTPACPDRSAQARIPRDRRGSADPECGSRRSRTSTSGPAPADIAGSAGYPRAATQPSVRCGGGNRAAHLRLPQTESPPTQVHLRHVQIIFGEIGKGT